MLLNRLPDFIKCLPLLFQVYWPILIIFGVRDLMSALHAFEQFVVWWNLWITWRSGLNWADHVNYTVKMSWKALHFIMRIGKKTNSSTKFSLHVTGTSNSWMWGCGLGSVQGGTNTRVRQGAKESGWICTSYERIELGNIVAAYKDVTHMCSLQSLLWRTDVEGCRWQITTVQISEQGWPCTEI